VGDPRQDGFKYLLAAILVGVIALFLWIAWPDEPEPVVAKPRPAVGAEAKRPQPAPANPMRLDPIDTDLPLGLSEDASPVHAAAFPWRSQIQCTTDLENGTYAFAALLPFDPNAVQVRVADGVLTAAVDHPYGSGSLRRGFHTAAKMTWSGAMEGQVGTCAIAEARPLEVRGYVEGGGSFLIVGCEPGLQTVSADDGSFSLEVPEGRACRIRAALQEDGHTLTGPAELVEVTGVVAEVVLFPPDREVVATESLDAIAAQLEAVLQAQEAVPTRLERALEHEDLDPGTRATLEQWVAEEAEQRRRGLDLVEEALRADDPQAALLDVLQVL